MYQITAHTRQQAKRYGLDVRPSQRPGKKMDVFRGGVMLGSIGALGMGDYGVYLRERGKEFADERRRLYRARQKDGEKDSPAWLARRLLW